MQRKSCRDFAERMGWTIVREEQENGISGLNLSVSHQDKLVLIKKAAEKKEFDILLVFMYDRIGRQEEETPFAVQWFTQHGIQVWSVMEGENSFESHVDDLLTYIRNWKTSDESENTSIRTKAAQAQMIQDGRFRGGHTPYGYRLENNGICNKRNHPIQELVIEESEAEIVRLIFELCAGYGYGRHRIANELRNRGLKNRKGENWHEITIGNMLHNVIYTGILRSGNSFSPHFENLRIVDQETFDYVQYLMAERNNSSKELRTIPLKTSGQSILSGNIFCGHCGGRLVQSTSKTTYHHADGTSATKNRVRYICYNKAHHREECCGQTGYSTQRVDELVLTQLFQLLNRINDPANLEAIYHRYEDTMVDLSVSKTESQLKKIKTLMEDIDMWLRTFEICNKESQKMILSRIIQKVEVFRDYQIHIIYSPEIQSILKIIGSDEPK